MTLFFNAKSCGAELRYLSATSSNAECRATVDVRLSQRANLQDQQDLISIRKAQWAPVCVALRPVQYRSMSMWLAFSLQDMWALKDKWKSSMSSPATEPNAPK
uniref:Uncharacterized protein n=1 Tax=Oryza sativa subsp. japonica TaxID=39947 RepID=Q10M81_ORYSJ|nr:hypothetical protein LOC_Os03g20400 [Oryza sativa Japonica Group]